MPTIPDQPPTQQPSLDGLRRKYPEWTIEGPAALHVYTAELRTHGGRSLHFLAGHDVAELAARLETATALDTAS
jgi:hypothetical protein